MVTDQQYRRLMKLSKTEPTLAQAADKAGMSERTARKYRRLGCPPSQSKTPRTYRTRVDPFASVWQEIETMLGADPGLQAVTIFDDLCQRYPDAFRPAQLRTLQRHIKTWRAQYGPTREVFFPQQHVPGRQAQSDFTYMHELRVTIAGQPFDHLLYHFTLTYSNWEWGSICFTESFESLADGLQTALWHLGGVPLQHRTDSLSAAVTLLGDRDEFTARYRGLLDHYGLQATHSSVGRGNENGDVEQSHHRFKQAVDQQLRLRASRDFLTRDDYWTFLRQILERRNHQRRERLSEDVAALRELPERRLEAYTSETVRVTRNSTVLVRHNFYSVPSQLIGERVQVRIFGEHLELWYADRCLERMERLRGKSKARIDYRHIIDSLVRKPGAFAHYRFQQSLFPRLVFRVAYDWLRDHSPASADKQYVRILEAAARTGEQSVASALEQMLVVGEAITIERVQARASHDQAQKVQPPEVHIEAVDLGVYDALVGDETEEVGA